MLYSSNLLPITLLSFAASYLRILDTDVTGHRREVDMGGHVRLSVLFVIFISVLVSVVVVAFCSFSASFIFSYFKSLC